MEYSLDQVLAGAEFIANEARVNAFVNKKPFTPPPPQHKYHLMLATVLSTNITQGTAMIMDIVNGRTQQIRTSWMNLQILENAKAQNKNVSLTIDKESVIAVQVLQ